MAELRWNPLLRDWTMVASHRQNRPEMPKDWCPFVLIQGGFLKIMMYINMIMIFLLYIKIHRTR